MSSPQHESRYEDGFNNGSRDGFGSVGPGGDWGGYWGGYWGMQGPELLDHRLDLHAAEQRTVFGANT